jgi:hypothetical protein
MLGQDIGPSRYQVHMMETPLPRPEEASLGKECAKFVVAAVKSSWHR